MKKATILPVAVAAVLVLNGVAAAGVVVPFTEDFDADNANWTDAAGDPLAWFASGGPDGAGDGYASGAFNFSGSFEGDQVALLRGEAGNNASGGAFTGDWLTAGVSEFSFFIRHDYVAPLFFFARFSGPSNFPGTVGIGFTPVMPNTWTEISIVIDPNNPAIIPEGPPGTFEATFGNVGNIQIGLEVPAGLAGFPADVTFDLDKLAVIPAPGALAMLGLVLLGGRRRRA